MSTPFTITSDRWRLMTGTTSTWPQCPIHHVPLTVLMTTGYPAPPPEYRCPCCTGYTARPPAPSPAGSPEGAAGHYRDNPT